MRISAVDSATLLMVFYDDARELLQLEFCSRAVYQYFQGVWLSYWTLT